MAHLQQQEEAANRHEATLEVLRRAKDKACSTDFVAWIMASDRWGTGANRKKKAWPYDLEITARDLKKLMEMGKVRSVKFRDRCEGQCYTRTLWILKGR